MKGNARCKAWSRCTYQMCSYLLICLNRLEQGKICKLYQFQSLKQQQQQKRNCSHQWCREGKTSSGRGEMRWNACLIRGRQLSPLWYWNRNLQAVPWTAVLGWLQVSLPSTPQGWLICFVPLPSHKSSCINYLQGTQFCSPSQYSFMCMIGAKAWKWAVGFRFLSLVIN